MKLKYFLFLTASLLICTSCSLISPKGTILKGSDGTTTTSTVSDKQSKPTAGDSNKTEKNEKPAKPAKQNKPKKSASSKTPSEAPSTVADQKPSQPAVQTPAEAEPVAAIDERLNGEWVIVEVDDKEIPLLDEMPYINFENSTERFYMSNTCNIINGDFKSIANSKLYFSNTLSTMKFCPDVEFEAAIIAVVSNPAPVTYKIENVGHESYILFYNTKGSLIMKARKHNMDFLNGNWCITRVGDKIINDDEANIFIDIAELKVHGNTGCNFFNGEIYIDPSKTNSIDFSNLASTRMACPKMEQESAIFLALEEAVSAIQGNADEAMLLDSKGNELMILRRTVSAE